MCAPMHVRLCSALTKTWFVMWPIPPENIANNKTLNRSFGWTVPGAKVGVAADDEDPVPEARLAGEVEAHRLYRLNYSKGGAPQPRSFGDWASGVSHTIVYHVYSISEVKRLHCITSQYNVLTMPSLASHMEPSHTMSHHTIAYRAIPYCIQVAWLYPGQGLGAPHRGHDSTQGTGLGEGRQLEGTTVSGMRGSRSNNAVAEGTIAIPSWTDAATYKHEHTCWAADWRSTSLRIEAHPCEGSEPLRWHQLRHQAIQRW